jgi:4-amino-4-deoxy-L-arabinose transferase-like glycosyltransferase
MARSNSRPRPGPTRARAKQAPSAPSPQPDAQPPAPPTPLSELLSLLDPAARPGVRSARTTTIALVTLAGLLIVLLLPFLTRAFHVDDPLFIWAARHIQQDPLDPYGFTVNWYGTSAAMSEVTKNPPLASYYIAAVASVLGWSELALHGAFLIPALAVAIGTYVLSTRFCRSPLLASLAAVLTPVFMVSSVTVMSDMLMLAFWVFAVVCWLAGLDRKNYGLLALAAVLVAGAAITKYFGMALIPLLLLYSLVKERRVGWWIVTLLIPVAVLAWYQWTTQQLYGRGLLLEAAAYASQDHPGFGRFPLARTYVACAFTGGCVASALFFARQLWSWRIVLAGLAFAAATAMLIATRGGLGTFQVPASGGVLLVAQLGIWGTVGISLIALAGLDAFTKRDADALLLFSWTIGTLLFAGVVNWTTNARSILPMVVPAGILIARRLEAVAPLRRRGRLPATVIPLVAAAVLSNAVTWADSAFADVARAGAQAVHDKYPGSPRPLLFEGHWGFQYYMEQLGGKAVDVAATQVAAGDRIVIPSTNTNIQRLPEWIRPREVIELPTTRWLSTMNGGVGAGFYADVYGPLPFAAGRVLPEQFVVYEVPGQLPKP